MRAGQRRGHAFTRLNVDPFMTILFVVVVLLSVPEFTTSARKGATVALPVVLR